MTAGEMVGNLFQNCDSAGCFLRPSISFNTERAEGLRLLSGTLDRSLDGFCQFGELHGQALGGNTGCFHRVFDLRNCGDTDAGSFGETRNLQNTILKPIDKLSEGACVIKGLGRSRGNLDRKSTRLNSSHANISYAVFCLKKKKKKPTKE